MWSSSFILLIFAMAGRCWLLDFVCLLLFITEKGVRGTTDVETCVRMCQHEVRSDLQRETFRGVLEFLEEIM